MKNKISNMIHDAIYFAAKKHRMQKRKSENEMPMIMHPISVGVMLLETGQCENVVVAGILHDTLEDTKTTYNEIKRNFNKDIADLVYSVTEKDKSLPWKQRKEETINALKTASLETKLIICADKVQNLCSHFRRYKNKSAESWQQFRAGADEQKWYYTNVYEMIIRDEEECELFNAYKKILNKIWKY